MKPVGSEGLTLRAAVLWSAALLVVAWWLFSNWLPQLGDTLPI